MKSANEIIASLKPKSRVLIVGSAFVDVVADIDEFPISGGDTNANYKSTVVGGCSFNVADVLYKLNLPFDSFMPIGEGTMGDIIEKEFVKRSYPIHKFKNRGDSGWCLSLVEKNAERTFITFPGVETKFVESDLDELNIGQYDFIYLSGYQVDRYSNCQQFIYGLLHKMSDKCQLVFDPGPRSSEIDPNMISLIEKHNVIYTINSSEAMLLTGASEPKTAVGEVFKRSHNSVVVTDGANGAFILDKNSFHDGNTSQIAEQLSRINDLVELIPSFKVKPVDTIGAGDSHTGGVLAGLMCGLSLSESVLLANKIASVVTSKSGAACAPSLEELEQNWF